jgi:hypothetical protein
MATYNKAIKVTVDGPREPRSKTSKPITRIFSHVAWGLCHFFQYGFRASWIWKILQLITRFLCGLYKLARPYLCPKGQKVKRVSLPNHHSEKTFRKSVTKSL